MALLEITKLSKHFGGLAAVSELDLQVEEGEILGLIGPNGAGKTTLFNVISGVYRPTSGKIIFNGEDITGLKPSMIAKKGLVRTFQATTLFDEFTVLANVLIGFHPHAGIAIWGALVGTPATRQREAALVQQAMEILDLMGIAHLKDELATSLPHGHQRCLGIAIAMAANPKLLLLDEPVTGMSREETAMVMATIRKIREQKGLTIIVVEHNMRAAMGLSDRMVVLNYGRKIAEGSPQEISENPEVIEAYLGAERYAA